MFDIRRLVATTAACLLVSSGLSAAVAEDYPQQEFIINLSQDMPDWRPHRAYNSFEAQLLSAVYEGLFVYDPYNMDPIPALAESWTLSANSLEWTFRMREGARFSNGEPITAAHVRDSWLTLLSPAVAAPYASLFDCIAGATAYRTGENADPSSVGIIARDQYTLVVRLSTPAPHLPKILCHHAFSVIYPGELALSAGQAPGTDFRPVASGAFRIASADSGAIVLEKNPEYWDAAHVALPSIRVILSNDAESLTARFNRGEIHWLGGSCDLRKVLGRSSAHITPMFATEYFFFRTTWGPWADSRVRNALLLSIPWAELREGNLIPAKTLVYPIAGYPEIAGLDTQNLDEARKKLAEAGIGDPSALPPLVISLPESEGYRDLAKVLETAWTGLGFRVSVRMTPGAEYYGSLRTDDYTLGISSWIGDFADPLAFLELFRPLSSLNDSGWNNSGYEKLITDAASRSGVKDRYGKLAEAEQLLLSEAVIIPVEHSPSVNVIETDGIAGWYDNPLDIHPFKFIRFVQRKPLPGVALADPAAARSSRGVQ